MMRSIDLTQLVKLEDSAQSLEWKAKRLLAVAEILKTLCRHAGEGFEDAHLIFEDVYSHVRGMDLAEVESSASEFHAIAAQLEEFYPSVLGKAVEPVTPDRILVALRLAYQDLAALQEIRKELSDAREQLSLLRSNVGGTNRVVEVLSREKAALKEALANFLDPDAIQDVLLAAGDEWSSEQLEDEPNWSDWREVLPQQEEDDD